MQPLDLVVLIYYKHKLNFVFTHCGGGVPYRNESMKIVSVSLTRFGKMSFRHFLKRMTNYFIKSIIFFAKSPHS